MLRLSTKFGIGLATAGILAETACGGGSPKIEATTTSSVAADTAHAIGAACVIGYEPGDDTTNPNLQQRNYSYIPILPQAATGTSVIAVNVIGSGNKVALTPYLRGETINLTNLPKADSVGAVALQFKGDVNASDLPAIQAGLNGSAYDNELSGLTSGECEPFFPANTN